MSKKIFELFNYQCLHGIEKYCNFAVEFSKALLNQYIFLLTALAIISHVQKPGKV